MRFRLYQVVDEFRQWSEEDVDQLLGDDLNEYWLH